MKKNGSRKKIYILLSACILLSAAVILIISQPKKAGVSETRTLRVSLYPIVPDMERYKKAVTMNWEAKHPDTKLELVDWYCYDEDLPDDLDVFVFVRRKYCRIWSSLKNEKVKSDTLYFA